MWELEFWFLVGREDLKFMFADSKIVLENSVIAAYFQEIHFRFIKYISLLGFIARKKGIMMKYRVRLYIK